MLNKVAEYSSNLKYSASTAMIRPIGFYTSAFSNSKPRLFSAKRYRNWAWNLVVSNLYCVVGWLGGSKFFFSDGLGWVNQSVCRAELD